MRILVACEYSGRVRNAFAKLGHDAWSCDLLESEMSGNHYQGNVFDIINDGWDMMVAHPPCTYLCNSGVRWLGKPDNRDLTRWKLMEEAALFFKTLVNSNIEKIAVENPIIHGHAKSIIGRGQDQLIQPWQFGHGEIKATCLWLKNLPHLKPTNIVDGRAPRVHRLPPSKDRWKERSRTYLGIASAMAEQWT